MESSLAQDEPSIVRFRSIDELLLDGDKLI